MQTQSLDGIADPLRRSARSVIADLRELAALTSTPLGAQRVAWGPVWKQARGWLAEKVSQLGLTPVPDAAGNTWVTLAGASDRTVIIGGHLTRCRTAAGWTAPSVCWWRWRRCAATGSARDRR